MVLSLVLLTFLCDRAPAAPLPQGKSRFTLSARGKRIEVFTFRPASYANGPLIVVMHGLERDAEPYLEKAIVLAERFKGIVVAPRFDVEQFPSEAYQRGGILRGGVAQPKEEWTFQFITEVVTEVRKREARPAMPYSLIGHSAGAQFLMRLAAFDPGSAERIVISNPGSLVFPTREMPFQYGFGGLPAELSSDGVIKRFLAAPVTLYLGMSDTGSKNLDVSEKAMKQGATRIARGRACYESARKLAAQNRWPFNWKLVEVHGVGHDSKKMFENALVENAFAGAAGF